MKIYINNSEIAIKKWMIKNLKACKKKTPTTTKVYGKPQREEKTQKHFMIPAKWRKAKPQS